MNRDQEKKAKRAAYVKNVVNKSKISTRKTVKALSDKLFLSERTIWDDLKK